MADANASGWEAVFTGAVAVPVGLGGWIRVRGEDRVRWLNGMVTNSIGTLTEGEGCLNLLLNAQGRIGGMAWAFQTGEELLLETDAAEVSRMVEQLDRFIIMDDVELADVSAGWQGIVVLGPAAALELRAAGLDLPAGSGTRLRRTGDLVVVHKVGRLFSRWEVWGPPSAVAAVGQRLRQAGASAGGTDLLEWARILEGVPRFGVDIRERELPQETGLAEALHFNKGCYLGQEIVERIRSRGSVHRAFTAVELPSGALPAAGSAVLAGAKPIGELTTVARIPGWPERPAGIALGLGTLRRESIESREDLRVGGEPVHALGLPILLAGTPPPGSNSLVAAETGPALSGANRPGSAS